MRLVLGLRVWLVALAVTFLAGCTRAPPIRITRVIYIPQRVHTTPGAPPCSNATACPTGQICCANVFGNPDCQAGPCPYVAPNEIWRGGPFQLCFTSSECFVAGDTCGYFTAAAPWGLPKLYSCNPPTGDGGVEDGGLERRRRWKRDWTRLPDGWTPVVAPDLGDVREPADHEPDAGWCGGEGGGGRGRGRCADASLGGQRVLDLFAVKRHRRPSRRNGSTESTEALQVAD
jgi:hypothetical protein